MSVDTSITSILPKPDLQMTKHLYSQDLILPEPTHIVRSEDERALRVKL